MEKKISIGSSVLLLALMMALIITSMTAFQAEPHIPLLICLVVVSIIGLFLNIKWDQLEKAMIKGVTDGTKAIIILSLVGIVIAVWMMSGTVPTILFYGLTFITPEWFAVSALMICMIVSSFTGSSFTTIGSVGVAMMGIGLALGVNPAMAAGAIICGACFGDKMSPLSDTTNLASGVTGVDLFVHIRHLMWTTIPSFIITLIIFFFIGRSYSTTTIEGIQEMLTTLDASFSISFLTLLSPLIVVILAFIRFPTVPALVVGILTGLLTVGLVQGNWLISEWFTVVQHGFILETGNDAINAIVDAGGLQSMMWSISLVIIALLLGSLIQRIGLIDGLLEFFRSFLSNRGNLIGATAASSISVNALTGEQYLSILLPSKAFEMHYERLNIAKKNLSRTLEDAGTLVNPLIPWGVSGAFFASTLGVAVMDYIPFAFFLFLSPILTVLFGYLGIGVGKSTES
ncbi:Na+/H+ antiporter NhaC [Shouchella lehensis]|uniref:Na(+)/H(+) antiporter nhaC n=2 Tax=Shouchella lehensis TaxID=300825 RepID=A0A060M2G6_9BACI|nr:Na+/H+ antiporter NhaC [Shouchella lehensis]AIC94289.1 Na(+)/H(+) antiporter nhaC [Shouchella lehensis G1]MBG9785898.1 sodium:proton antiporter [Shouchella lehensis]RQW20194.1 Na+/H+ antiporter NhaC [Bacillus sp. C1-1]TES48368.1 Na+/H+ antiporter NhaC [Shouchella lehensis]